MRIPIHFALRRPAALLALAALMWAVPALSAQELKPIQLPKPQITGGMPLMQALAQRLRAGATSYPRYGLIIDPAGKDLLYSYAL